MKYLEWDSKGDWAISLKVGDLVCDCRFKHVKIAEINTEDINSVYDIQIVTEDGRNCSVMYCCDAVDHPEEEHTEILSAWEKKV